MQALNQKMSTQEALDYFDSLDVVPAEMMIGKWRGEGVDTDHPMDGMLESSRWHGKVFEGPEAVFPLVHRGLFGGKFFANPNLMPIGLTAALPFRDFLVPLLFPLLQILLRTSQPKARLRMTEYRGKVSATMVYDAKAINDVFRKIDDDTVFGLMDKKGDERPYVFKLYREV